MKPVPVGLLAVTQPNWKQFIDAAQEAMNLSPTRGLDECASPTHRDPAAFLACLDLQNKPLEALRYGRLKGLFRHYFISFVSILSDETVISINEKTKVATYSTEVSRGMFHVTLSATMDIWYDAILAGCREDVAWEFRSVMNGIYDLLLAAGFREAFSFEKKHLADRSFILHACT